MTVRLSKNANIYNFVCVFNVYGTSAIITTVGGPIFINCVGINHPQLNLSTTAEYKENPDCSVLHLFSS